MSYLSRIVMLLALLGAPWLANASLRVFACEPEWAALASELGGDLVSVTSATTALQDPHHIQARPSLIARLRRADLLVCTGAQLEIGWLPVLRTRAHNPRIQAGQPGYLQAASLVPRLDVPQTLDRSAGDIHPDGNPHIQTNPHNLLPVARELSNRLIQIDPDNQAVYRSRLGAFEQRWQAALQRWDAQAAPLRGTAVVVHHQNWTYLAEWLGLQVVGSLEPKPGIPPSTGDLQALLAALEQHPARLVIHAAYQDDRPDRWLAAHAPVQVVTLPFTVGGTPGAQDLYGLYDDTLQRLLKALEQ